MPIKVHVFLTAKNKTKTCQIKRADNIDRVNKFLSNVLSNFFQISFKVRVSNFLNMRTSHLEVSCKKGVLKSFEKFIRKYPWCSLYFNKISGWESATLLKSSLRYMCFPKDVASFKNIYFVEHRGTAVSKISSKNEYPINSRIR